MKVKSNKLRASARLEDCTLNFPGVCNYDATTTVLAHLPFDGGMGTKSTDLSSCYACSACHDLIDGRAGVSRSVIEDYDYRLRIANQKTLKRFLEKDLIKVL